MKETLRQKSKRLRIAADLMALTRRNKADGAALARYYATGELPPDKYTRRVVKARMRSAALYQEVMRLEKVVSKVQQVLICAPVGNLDPHQVMQQLRRAWTEKPKGLYVEVKEVEDEEVAIL